MKPNAKRHFELLRRALMVAICVMIATAISQTCFHANLFATFGLYVVLIIGGEWILNKTKPKK